MFSSSKKKLEREIESLKQLTTISDLESVYTVWNETKHLEQEIQKTNSKLNSLVNEVDARGQDFVALYRHSQLIDRKMENTSLAMDKQWRELYDRGMNLFK